MSSAARSSARSQRNAPRPQADSRVVAVFHAVSEGFVGLVARRAGTAIEVIASRTFGKAEAGAAAWADEHLAARRVVVLPSTSVIVRAVQLPRAPEDKLASALELNATTFVLGRTPEFRVAAALLPGERGEQNLRTGIVAEWPLDQPAPPLPAGLLERDRVSFAPEIAALAALASGSGDPMVAIDAPHGAVSVAAPTSQGVLVRIVRAASEEGTVDSNEIGGAVGEACVHAAVPADEIARIVERTREAARDALQGGFGCTPETQRDLARVVRVPSSNNTTDWWRTHGVAAGTALVALGTGTALTQLQSQDPGARPDRAGVILNRIAEPKTASRLLVAAILTVILGPLAFQGIRLLILNWKLPDVAAYEQAESSDDQKRAIYRILQRNAASMTKTLSDIAAAAPAGVEIDSINIAPGLKGQSVTIRGKAGPVAGHPGTEAILEMEQLLRKSGMFEGLTRTSEPPNQGGWQEFTLNAVAIRPTDVAVYPAEQEYSASKGKDMKTRKWGPMPADVDRAAEGLDPIVASSAATTAGTATPAGTTAGATATAPATDAGSTAAATSAGSSESTPEHASASTTGRGSRATPTRTGSGPATITNPPGTAEAGKAPPPPPPIPAAGATTPAGTTPAGTTPASAVPAGETPAGTTPPAGAAPAGETPAGAASGETPANGETPTRGARAPALGKRGNALGGGSNEPEPPPPPLTEAEVNKMTKAEAQAALTTVSKARQRADISDEVKARLKTEFEMLLERCKRE